MKYFIGFLFAISLGVNACFLYSLKRYQIEIREQKKNTDQKIAYYEYWSFTYPRVVNAPDTTLSTERYVVDIDNSDTTLPERDIYVQFSHE